MGDPRVANTAGGDGGGGGESGVTPRVALPRGGPSWIVIAIGMAILGVLLFMMLDARRQQLNAPAVRTGSADRSDTGPAAPPSLYVPPAPAPVQPSIEPAPQPEPAPAPLAQPQPQIVYVPQPAPQPIPQPLAPVAPPRATADPALVIDTTSEQAPAAAAAPAASGSDDASGSSAAQVSLAGGRVRAAQLANRSTTVPQGTLIPAVLETGLDSTRPGLARAIVSKDVHGFDGRRVLIPRGSRLIGEYSSQASAGQKRALVNWLRLIRPDGATIAIGSPASDPLDRGGIKARVNSHFFERFAGAILQSSLDIGVNLASRVGGSSPIVVALPGTLQSSTQGLTSQTQQVTPTLKVDPGTSITIFVARDLDFTGAEARQ
jgi:type IV secretion system protein VirB10